VANGVYIGMSAAVAAQQRLEVVANNIANANTTGFRQQRVVFGEHLVRTLDGSPSSKGFTALDATVLDGSAGELQPTGNPLDVAIDGAGFFALRGPSGLMVSRAGNFGVRPDGTLVDGSGFAVLGGSPEEGLTPIVVRPDAGPVSVGSDGTVSQDGTPLARIAIVTADGPGLQPTGGAHLQVAPGALRTAAATLHTGHLEGSNVNPVRGMVELVEVNHDYTTSQKLMSEFRKLDRAVMGVMR
jgi:flagellar basal-body rod protein FlgF